MATVSHFLIPHETDPSEDVFDVEYRNAMLTFDLDDQGGVSLTIETQVGPGEYPVLRL